MSLMFSKELDANILRNFECGIPMMDAFIHNELASFFG